MTSRWQNRSPVDLNIAWQRRKMGMYHFLTLSRKLTDTAVSYMVRKQWGKLNPAWRIQPSPSITSPYLRSQRLLLPSSESGKITSLNGIRRFRCPRSIEFVDGLVLNDIDVVICATGYTANFSLAPFIQSSSPNGANGKSIIRLYQNLFQPQYAGSIAFLDYR